MSFLLKHNIADCIVHFGWVYRALQQTEEAAEAAAREDFVSWVIIIGDSSCARSLLIN